MAKHPKEKPAPPIPQQAAAEPRKDKGTVRREWAAIIVALAALALNIPVVLIAQHSDRAAVRQQRADRYTAAAGLLAAPSTGSRTAGVRALRQFAEDFPQERTAVIDLLSAYLSGVVPRVAPTPEHPDSCSPAWATDPAQQDVREALATTVDLYAAQRAEEKGGPTDHRLNLSGLCLSFADLAGKDLSYADLSGSWLVGAILAGADLDCAIMNSAFLQDTHLAGTRMRGTYLESATIKVVSGTAMLTAIDMREADLLGAEFVHLPGAAFTIQADLRGAAWEGARIGTETEGKVQPDTPATLPDGFGAGYTPWVSERPEPAPCPRISWPMPSPSST